MTKCTPNRSHLSAAQAERLIRQLAAEHRLLFSLEAGPELGIAADSIKRDDGQDVLLLTVRLPMSPGLIDRVDRTPAPAKWRRVG